MNIRTKCKQCNKEIVQANDGEWIHVNRIMMHRAIPDPNQTPEYDKLLAWVKNEIDINSLVDLKVTARHSTDKVSKEELYREINDMISAPTLIDKDIF